MSEISERPRSWVDMLALILAFIGALASFLGASFTYLAVIQVDATSLWPLPGLVLVDWILAGSLGFVAVYFSLRKKSRLWQRAIWAFTGSFIPLIILGAFSIGVLVLISFLLFIVSTVILAIRNRTSWFESFGLLMIGSIGNLTILMLIITLSGETL